MRLLPRGLCIAAAAMLAASCEAPTEVSAVGPLTEADQQIAALLYSGAPRTPAGFLADDAPPSFEQVTTYHLKTEQLALSYELCTDDWSQALAWSEEAAARSAEPLDLVASHSTDRYFELDRIPRGDSARYVRMRVFRCSYLDRTGADTAADAGFAGVLNARPLDAAALRDLSEYLWHFTPYNNAGHAVLASAARAVSGPAHALTIASLERGASGTCDRVRVRDWTHTAHAATGVLEVTVGVAREFLVRREGNQVEAC